MTNLNDLIVLIKTLKNQIYKCVFVRLVKVNVILI